MRLFKKAIISLSVLSILLLSGCVKKENVLKMESFKINELDNNVFIKKGELFYKLYDFSGASTSKSFQWHLGSEKDSLIPSLAPEDEIILHTIGAVPEELTIYSMRDFGYSTGIKFEQNKDGSFALPKSISENYYCMEGPFPTYLEGKMGKKLDNIKLVALQNQDFNAKLLSTEGFVKGLDKDTNYVLYLYQGTEYKDIMVRSDAHIFIKEKEYKVKNYTELKDKYFKINLPSNLEPGFWMIDGYGMFFLEENVELSGDPASEVIEEVNEVINPEELLEDEMDPIEVEEDNKSQEEENTNNTSEEVDIDINDPFGENSETNNSESTDVDNSSEG